MTYILHWCCLHVEEKKIHVLCSKIYISLPIYLSLVKIE